MNIAPYAVQSLHRLDRRVRRASLRVPKGVSAHRTGFMLEEALRLSSLPGEEQGRTYFFRSLRLCGLSATATRNFWIDACTTALQTVASKAVYGRNPHAGEADAVYFLSQQDALEWLLGHKDADAATPHWLMPLISGKPAEASAADLRIAALERLRALPAGWFAAASSLAAVQAADPAFAGRFIAALPPATARAWLWEIGDKTAQRMPAVVLSQGSLRLLSLLCNAFPEEHLTAVRRTQEGRLVRGGSPAEDPRLLWLAAMLVLSEHPGELDRGTLPAHARAVLKAARASSLRPLPLASTSESKPSVQSMDTASSPVPLDQRPLTARQSTVESQTQQRADSTADELDLSQLTDAGGLYFLLQVLRHLGIAAVLDAEPRLPSFGFVGSLLTRLAATAGVPSNDAALDAVRADQEKAASGVANSARFSATQCCPQLLPFKGMDRLLTFEELVRVWAIAVRRRCWRAGRLTVREIVCRSGRVLITRTDLDVLLPFESIDLRVRLLGLDIDPGWLPWFGRVVRFHYVRRPEAQ